MTGPDATYCPHCQAAVIERDWYDILAYRLDDAGHCQQCGTAIAGRFEKFGQPFGARRIPVRLHAPCPPLTLPLPPDQA